MAMTGISYRLSPSAPARYLAWFSLAAAATLATVACSKASIIDNGQGGAAGSSAGAGGGGGTAGTATGAGGVIIVITTPDAAMDRPSGGNCGDGILERNEGCDDGNTISGDGCSRICQVENNYECKTAGQPCVSIAICGNGHLTSDETCDDGNTVSGDGCSADCSTVEKGFQCRVPGKPCTPKCGDGTISGTETCDDGNTKSDDGCSATCHLEIGWKCSGTPSKCSKTTCGDGKKEGAESCDDGNTTPFDGCSEDCQIEPSCTAGSGCTSQCGDGIVLGEGCDDGNAADGDGCSKDCKVEPGWTCTQPPIGDTMKVPVIYRDFKFSKDVTGGNDFETGVTGSYNPTTGMVNASLDAKGKPVLSSTAPSTAHVASAASFATWYTDVSGTNHATASKLTLWNDGKGNYVNRYGANGEQWNITTPANYCGTVTDALLDADGKPIPCTFKYQYDPTTNPTGGKTDCQKMEDQGYTQMPGSCHSNNGTWVALYITAKVDGNPLFFPVDGDPFTPASELMYAQIPPYYDAGKTWPHDVDANGKDILHNFSFTSEVRYWFPFDSSKSYTLDFVGDDDVWVFINGKLAVDLGGVHTPIDGSIVIGSNGSGNTTVTAFDANGAPTTPIKSTASLGLQNGKVYEIAVFQAERQSTGSSYKLTLSGFNAAPTSCVPTCGDGVVVADEECDCGDGSVKVPDRCPGKNDDNTYGGCTTKCTWGTFCGDGIVNGLEECDSGKDNGATYGEGGCSIGCTKPHFCGDGHADTDRGEECDLGTNNGVKLDSQLQPVSDPTDPTAQIYCTADCMIPPGIVY
jgi:fibro-slime domain-containing protein